MSWVLFYHNHIFVGDIHKPREQFKRRGVSQITILLDKSYLVKVTTKGEGSQKCPKNWPHDLWTTPKVKQNKTYHPAI